MGVDIITSEDLYVLDYLPGNKKKTSINKKKG